MPIMDNFPNEVRETVPPLNSQEGVADPIVHLKFVSPDSNWIWYVTEGSAEEDDFIFFGFVVGVEEEWDTSGYPNWPKLQLLGSVRWSATHISNQAASAKSWRESDP